MGARSITWVISAYLGIAGTFGINAGIANNFTGLTDGSATKGPYTCDYFGSCDHHKCWAQCECRICWAETDRMFYLADRPCRETDTWVHWATSEPGVGVLRVESLDSDLVTSCARRMEDYLKEYLPEELQTTVPAVAEEGAAHKTDDKAAKHKADMEKKYKKHAWPNLYEFLNVNAGFLGEHEFHKGKAVAQKGAVDVFQLIHLAGALKCQKTNKARPGLPTPTLMENAFERCPGYHAGGQFMKAMLHRDGCGPAPANDCKTAATNCKAPVQLCDAPPKGETQPEEDIPQKDATVGSNPVSIAGEAQGLKDLNQGADVEVSSDPFDTNDKPRDENIDTNDDTKGETQKEENLQQEKVDAVVSSDLVDPDTNAPKENSATNYVTEDLDDDEKSYDEDYLDEKDFRYST